MIRSK